jgi:hypothetical protein
MIEAMKQALEAFEIAAEGGGVNFHAYAEELRQAIAELESQEPYGWVSQHTTKGMYEWQFNKEIAGVYQDTAISILPVYTAPPQRTEQEPVKMVRYNCTCGRTMKFESEYGFIAPQREWQGLTDDEIDQGLLRSDYAFKTAEAWRTGVVFAMTQLKEKNT